MRAENFCRELAPDALLPLAASECSLLGISLYLTRNREN